MGSTPSLTRRRLPDFRRSSSDAWPMMVSVLRSIAFNASIILTIACRRDAKSVKKKSLILREKRLKMPISRDKVGRLWHLQLILKLLTSP